MTLETANRLYEYRKKNNLSQEELAEKLGVSRQAVSKWERSEASPDTDNLIALAKLYGVTLDELVWGKKEDGAEEPSSVENDTDGDDNDGNERVNIGSMGLDVKSKNGDRVHIGLDGIHIKTRDSSVHIDKDDDDDDDDDFGEENEKKSGWRRFLGAIPYPILCTIAYLLFGFYDVCGGFGASWIIFVTIPLYYTLIEAIAKRKPSVFCYPVLAVVVFLYLGMYHDLWHPSWIVFVTIPIYYSIADLFYGKKKDK